MLSVEAPNLKIAAMRARNAVREWVREGDYGKHGARVHAWFALTDAKGKKHEREDLLVDIEPDHDYLIRKAGGDPDCEHRWISTVEVDGGLAENPGVYSTGGTSLSVSEHCANCGIIRVRNITGSQCNPGESDTVSYFLPEAAVSPNFDN